MKHAQAFWAQRAAARKKRTAAGDQPGRRVVSAMSLMDVEERDLGGGAFARMRARRAKAKHGAGDRAQLTPSDGGDADAAARTAAEDRQLEEAAIEGGVWSQGDDDGMIHLDSLIAIGERTTERILREPKAMSPLRTSDAASRNDPPTAEGAASAANPDAPAGDASV